MFTGLSHLYGTIDNQAGDADTFLIVLFLNLLFRAKGFVSFGSYKGDEVHLSVVKKLST